MTFLRYRPEIEQPEPEEQETIDGIILGMTQQSETVEKREHHAVRASHAKSSALVTGTLEIAAGLPPELAQGLFATPGSHPVAVRFAQGPGETLGDRVSTHRGMAIKIYDVAGEKLGGHTADTQDFVFASGPTFPSGTAKGFLRDGTIIGKSTGMPEGVKSAVSAGARNFNRLLHAFGTESPKADFFGHPFSHPMAEPYYSQAPIRFGDHVAKLGAFPVSDAQAALRGHSVGCHVDNAKGERVRDIDHAAVLFLPRLSGRRRSAVAAARSQRKSPEKPICSQVSGDVWARSTSGTGAPWLRRCWTASAR
jgi:hypothetical protein